MMMTMDFSRFQGTRMILFSLGMMVAAVLWSRPLPVPLRLLEQFPDCFHCLVLVLVVSM